MAADDGRDDPRSADDMARLAPRNVTSIGARRTAPSLVDELTARIAPGTAEEFATAMEPEPHVFQRNDCGLFPKGESSIIASIQRHGKTQLICSVAASQRLGVNVGGMPPVAKLDSVIITREDSRRQFIRKIQANAFVAEEKGGRVAGDAVRDGISVLDLNDRIFTPVRALVETDNGRICRGALVDALITAINAVQEQRGRRFGMAFLETASRFNECDETNPALRMMAESVNDVARGCDLAAVLTHHLSQAALANVRDLNVSTADVRGATTLVTNLRQTHILLNLGSDAYSLGEHSRGTLLRRMIDDGSPREERGSTVAVLVPLDSSKSALPPPIYFRQYATQYGPALCPIPTPDSLYGLSWLRQLERLRGMASDARAVAKDAVQHDEALEVVGIVRKLGDEDRPATANIVSVRAGHKSDWARPRLERAVGLGLLRVVKANVPRCKDPVDVYTPVGDSSASEGLPEESA